MPNTRIVVAAFLFALLLPTGNAVAVSASTKVQQRLEMRKSKLTPVKPVKKSSSSKSSVQQATSDTGSIDVGITVQQVEGIFYVQSMVRKSAAAVSGFKAGDQILEIGGKEMTHQISEQTVTKMLNGPEGTEVKVKIGRINEGYLTLTLKRIQATALADFDTSVSNGIGTISVHQFGKDFADRIRGECQKMQSQNVHGVIVDLREDSPGLLAGVEQLISCFLPYKTAYASFYMFHESSKFGITIYETKDKPVFSSAVKVVVIMPEKGAATATALAAMALNQFDNALVLRQRSMGTAALDLLTVIGQSGKEEIIPFDHIVMNYNDVSTFADTTSGQTLIDTVPGEDRALQRAKESIDAK